MNINFEIVEKFDDTELKKATENIITGVNASVQGYLVIGSNLDNINVRKLWKQAGFESFTEYSEKVLGISKATAYRIISVSKKFLMPEITKAIPDRIFSPFQDTALAALNPIGDYDTTAEFIAENGITPETPVSEIRKIVSEFQKEEKAEKEVDAESENENTNENSETRLQELLNKLSETAFEILDEKSKPKNKRKKTPLKNYNKVIEQLNAILEV